MGNSGSQGRLLGMTWAGEVGNSYKKYVPIMSWALYSVSRFTLTTTLSGGYCDAHGTDEE